MTDGPFKVIYDRDGDPENIVKDDRHWLNVIMVDVDQAKWIASALNNQHFIDQHNLELKDIVVEQRRTLPTYVTNIPPTTVDSEVDLDNNAFEDPYKTTYVSRGDSDIKVSFDDKA